MVRPIDSAERWQEPDGIEIWKASRQEMELWTLTVAQGFAESYPLTEEIIRIMKVFGLSRGMECYLASIDGKVAGGATLSLRGKIAGLFGAARCPISASAVCRQRCCGRDYGVRPKRDAKSR